jgi:hypothetical protein
MMRSILALSVAISVSGCMTTKRHKAIVGQYRAVIEKQSLMCSDSVRFLITERDAQAQDIERLQGLLKTQVVTNEEILQAAREGKKKKK